MTINGKLLPFPGKYKGSVKVVTWKPTSGRNFSWILWLSVRLGLCGNVLKVTEKKKKWIQREATKDIVTPAYAIPFLLKAEERKEIKKEI